jgi:hypothetical protein
MGDYGGIYHFSQDHLFGFFEVGLAAAFAEENNLDGFQKDSDFQKEVHEVD